MADPSVVRKLKADLTKAEAELRKWQGIVDGFKNTLLFYEPETELGGAPPAQVRGRSTPGRAMNDAMYEIIRESGKPWYYKDLYSELQARGLKVAGKEPVANVVAHLSGDDRFENVARGMWYLARSLSAAKTAAYEPAEPGNKAGREWDPEAGQEGGQLPSYVAAS